MLSKTPASREFVALLGRRDYPTDALQDYCTYLARALVKRGIDLQLVRVPWLEWGWLRALRWLWNESAKWQGSWVLVQYTALSWSRRGFPTMLLSVLWILRQRSGQVAVVFHDVSGYPGQRLIDRLRRGCQHTVMRMAYRWADKSILTIPLECAPWLPPNPIKAVFIPVGPNIPEPDRRVRTNDRLMKTVAIFGVTGGDNILREVGDIAYAVRQAAQALSPKGQKVRLVVLGRGSEEAEPTFRQHLEGAEGIEVSVLGLLPAEKVTEVLSQADVLLFVRGHISSRRGSALAGIACGLPVVAYEGAETGFPITEAGVLLAPQGNREALAEALIRVLTDDTLWHELHQRSLNAQRTYFSWDAIAQRFVEVLMGQGVSNEQRVGAD